MPAEPGPPSTDAALAAKVRPKPQRRPRDRDIAELARHQHGVVTLAQVERLGLSGRALRHRADTGRMLRVHRGVYAPGPLSREGRWMAALSAVADGALLSHRSAATLWGICDDDPSLVDVTLPRRAFRAPSGVAAHSGTTLRDEDRDRKRDRALAVAGYATHRYAASELLRTPGQVARELRALLATRQIEAAVGDELRPKVQRRRHV